MGFVSDEANVMTGETAGLVALVRRFVERRIHAVHCMAHRLHLAIIHAFEKDYYFDEFERTINALYIFYNSRGSKRKSHLRQTAKNMNVKMYEISYIYEVRWISSELASLNRIDKMWAVIIRDLEKTASDIQFNAKSRLEAKRLSLEISGKNFVIIFYFLIDVLQHLAFHSRRMKDRTALLIDYHNF